MAAVNQNYPPGQNMQYQNQYAGAPNMQGGYYPQAPQQQQGGYPPYQGQSAYAPPQPGFAPPQAYPGSSQGGYGAQATGQVSEKVPWNPNQATTYSGADVPADDVDENQAAPEETPSAPSYDLVVSGYENVNSVSDVPVGPPPPYESLPELESALVDTSKIHGITDDVAREALLGLVAEKTCWGAGAARDMDMKDVLPTNAYHYTLETYTEGRSTKYTHEPFKGGYVDGPSNGQAPLPWDIPCNCTNLFKTEVHKMAVPHTDVVKTCNHCWGRGFNRCNKCWGRGKVRCASCHGTGHTTRHVDGRTHHDSCMMCHGHGRRRCTRCHGCGCVVCFVCAGYGSVKQYIQLTVTFTNRASDHIVEKTDLPDELIRDVQGDVIFTQTLPRVQPIQNFSVQEINQKSLEIVQNHASSWPTERVLQQRHVLRSVPVQECHFEYKGKVGRFWVYGHQHKVFTQDYPHTCCCCAIL